MPVAMAVHAARLLRKCQTVIIIFNLNICCGDDSLVIWAGGISVYLFVWREQIAFDPGGCCPEPRDVAEGLRGCEQGPSYFCTVGAITMFWDYR